METRDGTPARRQLRGEPSTGDRLLALAGTGDADSFAALVSTWSPALLRTAIIVSGDRADAEAALSRTWLRTVPELGAAWSPPRFGAWLCGRLLEEILGGDPKELPWEPVGAALDPGRFHPLEHYRWPGHWSAPPVTWSEFPQELGRLVWGSVRSLPLRQRVVLALCDTAGCSVAEIADTLGSPAEHTRRTLNAARAGIRDAVELQLRSPAGT